MIEQALRVRDEAMIDANYVITVGVHCLSGIDAFVKVILQDSVIPKRDCLEGKPNEEEDDC